MEQSRGTAPPKGVPKPAGCCLPMPCFGLIRSEALPLCAALRCCCVAEPAPRDVGVAMAPVMLSARARDTTRGTARWGARPRPARRRSPPGRQAALSPPARRLLATGRAAGAGRAPRRAGAAARPGGAERGPQVRVRSPVPAGGACGGAMSQQWDVGRALALSGLFRVLQGAGRACAAPFLTLYLRHLGLPAALVGVVAGARGLAAALGAPLCSRCPRGRRQRRLLVAGCLLGSAAAGLLLTLVPPAPGAAGGRLCSGSRQPGRTGAAAGTDAALSVGAGSKEPVGTASAALTASGGAAVSSPASQGPAGRPGALGGGGRGAGEDGEDGTRTNVSWDGPSGWAASVTAVNQDTREAGMLPSYRPPSPGVRNETSSLAPAVTDLAGNAEGSLYATESNEPSLFNITLPTVGDTNVPGNLSDHQKDTRGVSFEAVQYIFLDREHQIFLIVLGIVVLWELLATSLEWTVDESLYEYLDFVDATDRYARLWIWNYLGASVGACGIAIFVDHLNCFLSATITRLAVHFYGYALLITLSLLVTVFFPIHVPKKADRVNKTAKALALLWSDSQAILYTITVFLTGMAGSVVHNFLFWQMQDQGSSELYMGLFVAVGLLAEFLLYFFKGKLLRTFSSSKIVAVSLSLLAIQLLCYSFLWTVWSALLIQILSAFSSGALWWAVNMTVDDIATPGMERSLHTVLQGLCYGGGASLGSFAGGFVVKYFGLAVLYRVCCVCLVLWLFLFLIVQSKLPRQKKINYSRLLAADSSDMSDSDEENERDWLVKAMKDESFNRNWSQKHGIS
ncbi:major facilitator superfamily domain-containing protein 6-like [Falco cherrug]|uniref:major facilitator superfamily domain-containing protein 6-like n=2 Tax=Falco TaxID=8952 RepID=UPI002478F949|nr:major facilitator superfamily domain-containing protein 6-like [Falco cherrug]